MQFLSIRNIIATVAIGASMLLIAQYQNCAPAGGGDSLQLGSDPTTTQTISQVPFSAGAISLPPTAIQVSSPISASSTLFGNNSTLNATCNWTITDSNGTALSSPMMTQASSSTCSLNGGLNAPATVGSFKLHLTATNSANESSSVDAAFTTSTSAPATAVWASLSSSVASLYSGGTVTLTAKGFANTARNLTVRMGYYYPSTNTASAPFTSAGCQVSATNTQVVTATCPVVMVGSGAKYFYVEVLDSGVTARLCQQMTASPDTSCTGSNFYASYLPKYGINVLYSSGGGGGGGCLATTATGQVLTICKPGL